MLTIHMNVRAALERIDWWRRRDGRSTALPSGAATWPPSGSLRTALQSTLSPRVGGWETVVDRDLSDRWTPGCQGLAFHDGDLFVSQNTQEPNPRKGVYRLNQNFGVEDAVVESSTAPEAGYFAFHGGEHWGDIDGHDGTVYVALETKQKSPPEHFTDGVMRTQGLDLGEAGESIVEGLEDVGEGAKDLAEGAKEGAEDALDTVEKAAKKGWGAAKTGVHKAAKKIAPGWVGEGEEPFTSHRVLELDAESLDVRGSTLLRPPGTPGVDDPERSYPHRGGSFPWCAVNPWNGYLYTSNFNGVEDVYAYDPSNDYRRVPEATIRLEGVEGEACLGVQGGSFSANGHLYLSSYTKPGNRSYGWESNPEGGDWVFAFDGLNGAYLGRRRVPYGAGRKQEMEGLTVGPSVSDDGDGDGFVYTLEGEMVHLVLLDRVLTRNEVHFKSFDAPDGGVL
jgi:hypothetical protein